MHPFHALCSQRLQQFRIYHQQARQQQQTVAIVLGLADGEVSHRANDNRLGLDALGASFCQLLQQTGGIELELGGAGEFGDDVVVVGVKPFSHLAGGDPAATLRLIVRRLSRTATRHAKVVVQHIALETLHALGQVA